MNEKPKITVKWVRKIHKRDAAQFVKGTLDEGNKILMWTHDGRWHVRLLVAYYE